ncbi:GNAT family N-acetyltransferase [Anaerorhabdus furcosa]|uniref:Acetyltransferase (GNAT) family protein n=1 Tax=Anaerorhabdus furcosa TaxID=118967 RepID=A0A1T4PT13_9FIRM|nr:GNAT family N-acetyltransferase [Anaerorhabdus furcosa]SJZ94673.1 Acetyltransferase (GNAT) family protein [Anaerorhabdus furcosa]
MSFNIRIAKEEECSIIGQYIRNIAAYEKMSDQVIWTDEQLYNELFVEKNAYVVFGEEDGNIVGFALYFFNYSTFVGKKGLYVEDVFVLEEYRKKGYGKQFFKYLAQVAVDKNCGRMEWICLDWNQPSIDFYTKRLGATPMDEWTVYRLTEDKIKEVAAM